MSLLVAVDFSDPSKAALREATRLAHDRDVPLIVVHAFGRGTTIPPGGHIDPIARLFIEGKIEEAHRLTHEVLTPLRKEGVDVRLVAEEGTPKNVLRDALATTVPEMVIVGHHSTGLHLGSVAKWLLDHADVPVLVVSR